MILQGNGEDFDQTAHSAASDLGLHCLPKSHRSLWNFCHVSPCCQELDVLGLY